MDTTGHEGLFSLWIFIRP